MTGLLPHDLVRPIERCVETLRSGGVVVLTDALRDIGVAGFAASAASNDNVNFLVQHCRGIVYIGASRARLAQLDLGHQVGSDVMRSHVYVAVDAVQGVTTGVSSADRVRTIRTVVDPASTRADLRTPGHVLPTAVDTTATVEHHYVNESLQYLCDLAGLGDGIALSAVLAVDGSMATACGLADFSVAHGLQHVDFTDVLRARRAVAGWSDEWPGARTISLVHLRTDLSVTALQAHRLHDRFPVEVLPLCATGHIVRAACACRAQLDAALDRLDRRGFGAVAVAWPTGQPFGGTGTVPCADHVRLVNPGLARLLAADLAAALPGACPVTHAGDEREGSTG